MTTVPKPSSLASGLSLTFDAWNRLSEVADGATVVARYEYDGQNRRIKKHLDSQSPGAPDGLDTYVHYFYNAKWQILETRQTTTESDQPENLQPKYQHVWTLRYIDSPILRDENTDQDSLCDDQRLYYLNDANFNVTSLIDTSGGAVERYLYNPYGKVTIYDGSWSSTRSTSSYNNATLYTGRELDPETGMMHYRWRFYSTELGRFLSRDPIGYDSGDENIYRYVLGAPVNETDPKGLACELHYECTKLIKRIGDNCFYLYTEKWDSDRERPDPQRESTSGFPRHTCPCDQGIQNCEQFKHFFPGGPHHIILTRKVVGRFRKKCPRCEDFVDMVREVSQTYDCYDPSAACDVDKCLEACESGRDDIICDAVPPALKQLCKVAFFLRGEGCEAWCTMNCRKLSE